MTGTQAQRYSSERAQRELFNEYQHDKVYMVFKRFCIVVLWTKEASALEGLNIGCLDHLFLLFQIKDDELIVLLELFLNKNHLSFRQLIV